MRITQNMVASNSIYNLQQSAAKLTKLSDLTASGQNITTPSDDPIASRLLVQLGDQLKLSDQYSSNISKATTLMSYTSTALTGINDVMKQIEKVAGSINSGSADSTSRQSAHDQLVNLKAQLVDLGNTQYGDQYIFGGAANTTLPYTTDPLSGAVTWNGTDTQLNVEISQNSTISLNVTGAQIFQGTGTPSYGTTDIFGKLDKLITAVGDNRSESDVTGITQGLSDMEAGSAQLINASNDITSRTTRLSNMATLNDNTKNTMNSIVGSIQTVDYNKLGIELSQQQTAYNAALASTAKVQGMSLLDYMK